ncbi:MAG: GNAT family N-acetyltransferase [Anaerolineae bacterium]|nr:GNAT family N-acetyltransferase [Anaerolineae bacterium]
MTLYLGQVPQEHKTSHFVFRPLSPDYTELDYDAVMASKLELRKWSHSTWPEDDFTLDDNRDDLQRHYEEFQTGKAYAFTVLNLEESRVEGCLYIDPLQRLVERFVKRNGSTREIIESLAPDDAHLAFWIRSERLGDESLLLREAMKWLLEVWQFPQVTCGAYHTNPRQAELFESLGMRLRFHLVSDKDIHISCYVERPSDG